MSHIYITYNRADIKIAKEISSGLKNKGHKIILDDDVLLPGHDWRSFLTNALETSTVVIAIISENSLQAQFVLSEIGATRASRKPLSGQFNV